MSRRKQLQRKIYKLDNKYLVVRNFIGLCFFFLAALILSPLNRDTDLAKLLLVLFNGVVILLSLGLMAEFVLRTLWLQNEPKVNRYSAIVSLNSFFGLVLPLTFINILLHKTVFYLGHMNNYKTIFCELRSTFVDFYYDNNVYHFIYRLIFWLVIMAFALFLFGGAVEKIFKNKK